MPEEHSDVLRASEIGTYCFCQRAWSYQRRGLPSQNAGEMAEGDQHHIRHGRSVRSIRLARSLAFLFFAAALIVIILQLLS